MYYRKYIKRFIYQLKLGKELIMMVLGYVVLICLIGSHWPNTWNYEAFSILNQLLLPIMSCLWMNAFIYEWIEGDNKELFFFYTKILIYKEIIASLIFAMIVSIMYIFLCRFGMETYNNFFVEIIICFLFQAVYCFGILIAPSSTMVILGCIFIEIVNAIAYLKNSGLNWTVFLYSESVSNEDIGSKYSYWLLATFIIWGCYIGVYWRKKEGGKLWQ